MSGKNLPGGLIRIRDNEDGTQSYIFDKFCIFTKGYMTALNDKVPKPSIEGNMGIYLPVYSYGNMIKPAVGPEIENTELFATYDGNGHYSVITQDPISGPMNTLILSDVGGSDWFVFQNLAQTLTNKTLTSPTLNNATLSAPIFSGTTSGILQNSSQYCFKAYNNVGQTGVTGAGEQYTVIFDTIDFQVGTGYNNSNGVFQAPINGLYHFTANIQTLGWSSSNTTVSAWFYHNTTKYNMHMTTNISFADTYLVSNFSTTFKMAAGDIVYVGIEVDGNSTPNIGIVSGSMNTNLVGTLLVALG